MTRTITKTVERPVPVDAGLTRAYTMTCTAQTNEQLLECLERAQQLLCLSNADKDRIAQREPRTCEDL